MRAIVQRVTSASVSVGGEVISQISRGYMVLVGINRDDTERDMKDLVKKILSLRAFPDATTGAHWRATIRDVSGEILCVSQFTLFAKLTRGKPDFHRSMAADSSKAFYATFLEHLGNQYSEPKIKDGRFGAMMDVTLTNDGPVTFTLDSRNGQDGDNALSEFLVTSDSPLAALS